MKLKGDVTQAGVSVVVQVDVSVASGVSIPDTVEQVRTAIRTTLLRHPELNIAAIDITVHDLFEPYLSVGSVNEIGRV
ncbi:hypothetical protein [Glaciihabitans sp. UYNi722]|uniref:hypothetical protein n=1 Tax=Glaciihabitans sp. UYNi722 TaxID=3156344 RepID=UPI00339333A9